MNLNHVLSTPKNYGLFIISAGYGVLDPLNLPGIKMLEVKGKVARHWRDAGLLI